MLNDLPENLVEVSAQLDMVLAKDPRFAILKQHPAAMSLLTKLVEHSHEYVGHDAHHVFEQIVQAMTSPQSSVQTVEQQVDMAVESQADMIPAPIPPKNSHQPKPGAAAAA